MLQFKMKLNKKAMILYYPLLVGIALAAAFFYYAIFLGHPAYGTDFTGEVSLKLIDFAQEAEKLLINIDQAAKILAQQSVYDLAKNGGLIESECGQYLGLNVLNKIEKENSKEEIKFCIEKEKIKDNLTKIYSENLNSYFSKTDALSSLTDNYEIEISIFDKKTIFNGKNKEGLVVFIGTGKEEASEMVTLQEGPLPEGEQFWKIDAAIKKEGKEKYYDLVKGENTEVDESIVQEIRNRFLNMQQPVIVSMPMESHPDVKTILENNPELLVAYKALLNRMEIKELDKDIGAGRILSGYRSYIYNKQIGGVSDSAHRYGLALDIAVGDVREQIKWAREADKIFNRIGVYPNMGIIHVDLMPYGESYKHGSQYWVRKRTQYIATSSIGQMERIALT